jgi:hypothetical protein
MVRGLSNEGRHKEREQQFDYLAVWYDPGTTR